MDPVNKNPKKKIQNVQNRTFVKRKMNVQKKFKFFDYAFMYLEI